MMVGQERLLDMTPLRREESDSTPRATVSALYINVPISYIMSSRVLRFHQMNQTLATGCPVSSDLAGFSFDRAGHGFVGESH